MNSSQDVTKHIEVEVGETAKKLTDLGTDYECIVINFGDLFSSLYAVYSEVKKNGSPEELNDWAQNNKLLVIQARQIIEKGE